MNKKHVLFKKGLVIGIIILFIGLNVIPSTGTIEEKPYVNIQYTPHDPIYIHGNDDFTSENGVTSGSGTSSDPFVIEDWEIEASSQDGITIRNVDVYFTIKGCYIHDGGINNDGIVFINVTNGEIEETIITGNRNGVMFRTQQYPEKENSSENYIHHNNITDNTKDGIHFQHTGEGHHSNNLIYLNNLVGNNQGIDMVMSAYNQIFSNNIISNSRWGVNLTMCMGGGTNNRVYHNNFINNGDENSQACVWWTLDNDWDDGYPSGGNFWSDYGGVDNFSGPNQNIPGNDGIGDTPYNITLYWDEYEHELYPFEYDYYPLMEPWGENLPPFADFTWTPYLPEPGEIILFNASDSFDYDGYITLYEWDWDNDGEYDENYTNPTTNHTFEEAGYYLVTLCVHDNESENDTKTKTVRVGNQPPFIIPEYPWNGSTVIPIDIELIWSGGDPDGDLVTYDVYIGTSSPPPKIVSNQSDTSYDPGLLEYCTTYYWQIVAWDEHGAYTEGPIWSFTTNCKPDAPDIDGPSNGKPRIKYEYTFVSIDPDEHDVFYYIDWDDGDSQATGFNPSGTDVNVNHTWSEEGDYTIRAKARDIHGVESNWSEFEVEIPRNRIVTNMWFHRLIGCFPLLEVFLRAINLLR